MPTTCPAASRTTWSSGSTRCARPGAFFHRSVHDRTDLNTLVHEHPTEGLALLLADLHGPQRQQDLREWLVGREIMNPAGFSHWWRPCGRCSPRTCGSR
ncbi:MAG: hypothetical protein R3F59_09640 [Myxococcota bacterium]